MKSIILTISCLILTCYQGFSQNCVKVDTVYTTSKIKDLQNRRITFGIKQIAEEELSGKFRLCQEGEPIKIEVAYVGTPKKSFSIGGIGGAVQTTETLIKIHFMGKTYQGEGSEETSAQMVFIQLKDDQIPFDKTTLSTALKLAIKEAVSNIK
jgi:hypothetical protein